MKKFFYTFVLLTTLLLPAAGMADSASAGTDVLNPVCNTADPNNLPAICKDDAAGSTNNPIFGPDGIITRATQILALLVGVAAVIAIIIYGLKMVSTGGDPGETKTARQGIVYSLVALVIAALAQGIVTFVLNKL